MAVYCMADIHGCYKELLQMLEIIEFDSGEDQIYILGDTIDRGEEPIKCLKFALYSENVTLILGNHEKMMLDWVADPKSEAGDLWNYNSNLVTLRDLLSLPEGEIDELVLDLKRCSYLKVIRVNGMRYFLSHAGLDMTQPQFSLVSEDLVWSRHEFYDHKALLNYFCVFGHTPTPQLNYDHSCSVWFDHHFCDKLGIDSGCVFGGALSAVCLDNGRVFYVKNGKRGHYDFEYSDENVPFHLARAGRGVRNVY